MQAYDGYLEQPLADSGLEQSGKEILTREGSLSPETLKHFKGERASMTLGAMDLGIKWARDDQGNFVTKSRYGRLLTRNDKGQMVDYEWFTENRRMNQRSQMALTSVLFCNPLMLFGMGATFAFMDQMHAGNREKNIRRLTEELEGKKHVKSGKGYNSKEMAKALLLANDRRYASMEEPNGVIRGKSLEGKRKKQPTDGLRSRPMALSMVSDRNSLSRNKLVKMKIRLTEQLERMRGNASHKDIAKVEAQIEKLDRALKRFVALSL